MGERRQALLRLPMQVIACFAVLVALFALAAPLLLRSGLPPSAYDVLIWLLVVLVNLAIALWVTRSRLLRAPVPVSVVAAGAALCMFYAVVWVASVYVPGAVMRTGSGAGFYLTLLAWSIEMVGVAHLVAAAFGRRVASRITPHAQQALPADAQES